MAFRHEELRPLQSPLLPAGTNEGRDAGARSCADCVVGGSDRGAAMLAAHIICRPCANLRLCPRGRFSGRISGQSHSSAAIFKIGEEVSLTGSQIKVVKTPLTVLAFCLAH